MMVKMYAIKHDISSFVSAIYHSNQWPRPDSWHQWYLPAMWLRSAPNNISSHYSLRYVTCLTLRNQSTYTVLVGNEFWLKYVLKILY